MESNDQQCPMPDNSNRDRASNSPLITTEEVLSIDEHIGPNNQHPSYHRRLPDGEYVGVVLSPGYRFFPDDDELIVDYLNKEINKERPEYIRILNVNVYNHSPQELARSHQSTGKDEWYFFSSRDRKYRNGNRPNRAAGDGYWKATGADQTIYRDGVLLGSKKCLVFYVGKPPKGDKTDWIMHEYVSEQPPRQRTSADDMRLDDCVLCRIYKKSQQPPKTEREAAVASQRGHRAKSATRKSSKRKNQTAPKRLKPQNQGTNNQQLNLPGPQNVQQINHRVQQANPLTPQQMSRRPVPQMIPEHLQVQHLNPPTLHQINLPVPELNPQTMHQNFPVPRPNPLTMQQNLETIQYGIHAASRDHNLVGMLDRHLGSFPQDTGQSLFDIVQSGHGNFTGFTHMDMVGNLTPPQILPNGFSFTPGTHDQTFNSYRPFTSTDSFNPDSLLRNNDPPDPDDH